MEAASVSVEMSLARHGSRVEEQRLCGLDSPDQRTEPSCRGGQQRRVWGAVLDPVGNAVTVSRLDASCIWSRRVRAPVGERVRVALHRRVVS